MVTLRQLRYLDALARHRHFGRAAEDCAVTQPALSMQIQELEAALGLPLVERRRGGVKLTSEGREIVRRGSRVLCEMRDMVDFAHHHGKGLEGSVRIGVIPSIAPYLLPTILPSLDDQRPRIELHLRETQTDTLVEELVQGLLDVILLALPVEHRGIETLPLFEDRFLLAVPKSLGLASSKRASAEMVVAQELLLLEEGHCLRDQALEFCKLVRPDLLHSFGATSLTTLLQLVANGHGVTLLPEMCLTSEISDPRVTLLRFEEPEPSRMVGLAWRDSSPRADAFRILGQLIVEARELAALPKK